MSWEECLGEARADVSSGPRILSLAGSILIARIKRGRETSGSETGTAGRSQPAPRHPRVRASARLPPSTTSSRRPPPDRRPRNAGGSTS